MGKRAIGWSVAECSDAEKASRALERSLETTSAASAGPRVDAGFAPLRILFVAACPFPCTRGTPARVLSQVQTLKQFGVAVEVVAYSLRQGAAPPEIPVHRTPALPGYHRLEPGPTLQKLLFLDPLLLLKTLATARRRRAQILHGHHVEGGLVALAASRCLGLPVVFDAHTSLCAELQNYPLPLPASLARHAGSWLDAVLARFSQHVITASEHLRNELLARCGPALSPAHISWIPTALDPQPACVAMCAVRKTGAESSSVVVYAGGLARFQRIDLLREAFGEVWRALPETHLLIVSEDPAKALETQWPGATRHPRIRLVCPSDLAEMFALLREADVAVSPRTATGGLPQKLLNYLRVGLPIVASQGSGEILHNGETGLVVPNDDPRAFAQALIHLLRDPKLRRQLASAGRSDVEQRFRWSNAAGQLLSVYTQVLRNRAAQSKRGETPSKVAQTA